MLSTVGGSECSDRGDLRIVSSPCERLALGSDALVAIVNRPPESFNGINAPVGIYGDVFHVK